MKKIVKLLTLGIIGVTTCFSFTGCFSTLYTREGKNTISETCNDCVSVSDIKTLTYNVENTMKKVGAVKGVYNLTNTKDTYEVTFDMIIKEKRQDWDLYAITYYKEKDITIYFKDKKFYIIYPNNGANLIMKDSLENLVDEAEKSLDELNATYDKENLSDMMLGNKLEGFEFELIREKGTYVDNGDGTYILKFEKNGLNWEYDIASNYLIKEVRCQAINFNSKMELEYPENISITYPMGLDFLTVDIEEVKEILEIDTFAEILDEDLKENNKEQSE